MNEPTSEQKHAIDVARQLAAAGVPIFLAEPAMTRGRWDPAGGTGRSGYHLPRGWERVPADPAVLDRWRPGVAVCAVMGQGLDLIDIDPRNGGSPETLKEALHGRMPPVHAQAATPSGGWHAFVRTLGVTSRDDLLPGIDIKAGDGDGRGRGCAFIAPTVKLSKTTGETGTYRWERPPDLDALSGDDGSQSGPLAELVLSTRNGQHTAAQHVSGGLVTPGQIGPSPWDDLPDTIPPGKRHATVYRLACSLRGAGGWRHDHALEYIRTAVWPRIQAGAGEDGADYTLDELEADVRDAFTRHPDGNSRRPLPPPHEPPTRHQLDTDEEPAPPSPSLEFVRFADLAARVDASGPRKWLLRGIWPAGDYGVHAAEPKAQKTWNSTDLAVSVATGTPWLGAFEVDTPGPVLIFHGEGGSAGIVRRVRAVLESRGLAHREADLPLDVCTRAPHLSSADHLRQFAERVQQTRPSLVILDPLYLSAGKANLRDLYEMGGLLEAPQHICQDVGASFWVNHHFNRQQGTGSNRITGAGPAEWGRVLITAVVKARHTDTTTRATDVITELDVIGGEIPDRTLRVRRHVIADDPDDLDSPLRITVEAADRSEETGDRTDSEGDLTPAARKLLEALEASTVPATGPELVDWIVGRHGHGLKRETVSRTLNDLERRGRVVSEEGGQFKPKRWTLASAAPDRSEEPETANVTRHHATELQNRPDPSCDPRDITRDGHTGERGVTGVTAPIGGHASHDPDTDHAAEAHTVTRATSDHEDEPWFRRRARDEGIA